MLMSNFQKIVLGLAGFTAFVIGAFIMLAPHAFYASYGIALDNDPNVLSELRGPGANLAALGVVVVLGVFMKWISKTSVVIASVVFVAFPLGRAISIAVDGMPSESILAALAIELVVGAILLLAFGKRWDEFESPTKGKAVTAD